MNRWLVVILSILAVVVLATLAVWVIANIQYRQRMAEAEAAWTEIVSSAPEGVGGYDPAMVAGLPEIAQRYFNHAIAPGTPLRTVVELTMEGQFHLGTKDAPQTFALTARQALAAPSEFIWMPKMTSGVMVVSGSDALYQRHAWTRFWLLWSLPLVQASATEGLDRSALARPALESIWAPAALLPQNGARWEQTGPDTARVTVGEDQTEVLMDLTIDADGRVLGIVTQRWSDANPEKTYRLQPFGGTMSAEATFDGFTIPSDVHVGNFFGTPDYFEFFNVTITSATYH